MNISELLDVLRSTERTGRINCNMDKGTYTLLENYMLEQIKEQVLNVL